MPGGAGAHRPVARGPALRPRPAGGGHAGVGGALPERGAGARGGGKTIVDHSGS